MGFDECGKRNARAEDSVIPASAYEGNTALETVFIASRTETIGEAAFYDCTHLERISFEAGGVKKLQVGAYAFAFCRRLRRLHLPARLQKIGTHAFFGSGLQMLCADPCNPVFYDRAGVLFRREGEVLEIYPPGRAETVYSVPDGTMAVADGAFEGAACLLGVILPGSLRKIGAYAFLNTRLEGPLALPEGLETIGPYAFAYAMYQDEIRIGREVSYIGEGAFCGGTLRRFAVEAGSARYEARDGALIDQKSASLIAYPAGKEETAYTVPEDVASIGERAFYGNEKLQTVTILPGVKKIGAFAFEDCSALRSIRVAEGSAAHAWAVENAQPFSFMRRTCNPV